MVELLLIAPQANVETVSDALTFELGALAVSVEDADAGSDAENALFGEPGLPAPRVGWDRSVLRALFTSEAEATEAATLLLAQDWAADVHLQSLSPVADQDWVRLTQSQFAPVEITPEFWIVPSWHDMPSAARRAIRLDPGLAFGTGTHPTTALCLEWLDDQDLHDCSVLDFGCGSGILAIAALLLGAPQAFGTDIDPQALEASRDNAGRNGIDPARFPVYLPADLPQQPADVVVANILAGPLVALAPQITELVKNGGRLALSGILAEQAEEVRAAYSEAFTLDPTAEKHGWVRITGVRRA